MIGAIIGDIVGSIYEYRGIRDKNFELFNEYKFFTDDTVLTCAVAKALLKCDGNYDNLSLQATICMQDFGCTYRDCNYGSMFSDWLHQTYPKPYNSFGNGSAMRISPVAYVAKSLNEVKSLSRKVTKITHNHPEGLKGAEAVAVAIWLALHGESKENIKKVIEENYYKISDNYENIPTSFQFDATCQGTIPLCFYAFFNSSSFEDSIRTAISFGGDTDTMGAITGSIAEAFYGVPSKMKVKALKYLDKNLVKIVKEFTNKYKK